MPNANAADPVLVDATRQSGIDFVHFNGMSGELFFIEMMGAGGALFDYDHDGDLDIYFVQGHMLGEGKTHDDATFPPVGATTDQLYRNDSERVEGQLQLQFTNVTRQSGIVSPGYGMGVTVGDVDQDGHVDLYVMNYGDNMLWRNRGDGTFEDITAAAGVNDPRWSVSASFVDYDRDGLPDLYVGNYLEHDISVPKVCRMSKRVRDYCGPSYNAGETDSLFRNLGDGRFENASESAGIDQAYGGALGIIAADFNGDSWPDIFVANDGVANQLWVNQQDGTFEDQALLGGVAVNRDGMAEGSMGIDAQDFDNDGDFDVFLTHFLQETNTLYVNDGSGWFEDESVASGLGNPSFRYTAFGAAWFDLDNDGWLDLFSVNGAVKKKPDQVLAGDPYPLHESNQLFVRTADGRYSDVSADVPDLAQSRVSRGAAFGDIDNDGDIDILVLNNAAAPQLLINTVGQTAGWIGLDLLNRAGSIAVGAEVRLLVDDKVVQTRRVRVDGSYASANDARVLIGLGKDDIIPTLEIKWPDGSRQTLDKLQPGRYHRIQQRKPE
ncbi:MAG: CRTAC1 family protein [Gammaproteobacteria bacterium]|nr:CRTAC1 family protein [Gammaproteobacteria bacterium]